MDLTALTEKWAAQGEELHPFPMMSVTHPQLSEATRTYLVTVGLPEQAAPSLDFPIHPVMLQTPNQYFRIAWEGLDKYLVIGHNGSGDPVCIDLATGNEIVYLNHDNSFERIFINTTIEQFSHSLLLYKLFYASLINATDPNDFSIRKFTDGELNDLQTDLLHIDAKALDPASFWKMELDALVWERDH
jgi:hypothetical protein